jgi:ribose transport system substrate-binding protein
MKIKSTALMAAGVLALSLAGCSNAATDTSPSASPGNNALPASCTGGTPTIGVALPNTVNPYYVAMKKSFEDHGKELGYDVKVAIGNYSDSNQLAQIDSFVQQGVCAVALNAVNSGPGAASVAKLNAAKIPVFTVNVIISDKDLKTQNASYVQYVGADQVAGGKQMGEQALKDLGKDAKIVAGIIGNPDQIPTNQRDEGFTTVLKTNPNAKVTNTVYAFCAADTPLKDNYAACAAQEPAEYAKITLDNIKTFLGGGKVENQVLQPLKVFVNGQAPGAGEVG